MAQAQSANDDIAVAIAQMREADAQARIAGAALLPSVALSSDATRQRTLTGSRAGRSDERHTRHQWGELQLFHRRAQRKLPG